jgi:polysaccharide biosynthesis transport protein
MKDFKTLEVGDYFRILWRRKWYVIGITPLVIAGAVVYAWRQPLYYRSETRILLESPAIPEDLVRSGARARPQDRIDAIRTQIQSREFIVRLVELYRLYGYGSDPGFSMERAVGSVRQNIQIVVASGSTLTLSFLERDPQRARDITSRLADMLVEESNRARGKRADQADQFVESQLEKAQRELTAQEEKIRDFKTRHLGELPEQSSANINILNGLTTQLASVENSLERARDQLKVLDFRLEEQKRLAVLSENLGPAPAAGSKPEAAENTGPPVNPQLAAKKALLAELTAKYTDKHPDVIRMAREVQELERALAASNPAAAGKPEVSRATELTPLGQPQKPQDAPPAPLPDSGRSVMFELAEAGIRSEMEKVKDQIAKLEQDREEIGRQMKIVQDRLKLAPALEQELLALTRYEAVLQQQYTNLQNKKFNTQMAKTLEMEPDRVFYRVIDPATLPEKPVFPDRKQMVLIGIGAGLLFGIGGAFARELFDSTVGSEEEAVAVLSLPVLAAIPEIPSEKGKGGSPKRIRSAA